MSDVIGNTTMGREVIVDGFNPPVPLIQLFEGF